VFKNNLETWHDHEASARRDAWDFLRTIETYTIGDIVKSTHTCVQDDAQTVVVLDLNIHGFVTTTTQPILNNSTNYIVPEIYCQIAHNFSKRDQASYSAGCLGEVLFKSPFSLEEYLTSQCEGQRLLGRNLAKLQSFVDQVNKTPKDEKWRLFLPSEKVMQANRKHRQDCFDTRPSYTP
jgi:hypothetical protein